jgi:hypothetical protein
VDGVLLLLPLLPLLLLLLPLLLLLLLPPVDVLRKRMFAARLCSRRAERARKELERKRDKEKQEMEELAKKVDERYER